MKSGWQKKALGEVCTVDKIQDNHRNLPYVGLEHIEAQTSKFIGSKEPIEVKSTTFNFTPKHVLYGRLRPYLNKVMLPDFTGHCSTEIFPLKPGPTVLREYLKYWLLSDSTVKKIDATSTGARMPRANMNAVLNFEFPLPEVAEQKRIVAILDEAFEGIATAKANAEKNLQNARALFESYLDFIFSNRGVGMVEKKMSEVCEITSTLVDPREDKYLDLVHVGAGNIESKTGALIELKTAKEEGLISGKFLFDESMVLYSKIRPYLMKVVRPDFHGLCSADIYPLTPLPSEITRNYLYYLLLSKGFTDYAIQGSARAGMPKVNREHLFEFKVWLPLLKEQNEMATKLDALHKETQHLADIYERKNEKLEALKKSLLHQAFAGEL